MNRDALDGALGDALAPIRPDPREFSAGVAERLKERSDRVPDEAPTHAPWIRSAAAILPPGLFDLALIGKYGSAAKTASPGASLLAGPWALLAIVLVGLVAMAVVPKRRQEVELATPAAQAQPSWLLRLLAGGVSVAAPSAPLLMITIVMAGGPQYGAALIAGGGTLLALSTWLAGRSGLMDRRSASRLWAIMLFQFANVALMAKIYSDPSPFVALASPLLLMTGAWIGWRMPRVDPSVRGILVVSLALLAAATLWLSPLGRPFSTSQSELIDWVESTRLDPDELSLWEEAGLAAATLAAEDLDLEAMESAYRSGPADPDWRPHPAITLAAWRAGFATPEDLERHEYRRFRVDRLASSERVSDTDLVQLLSRHERGAIGPDERAEALAALEVHFIKHLEAWGFTISLLNLVEIAESLSGVDLVEAHRGQVRELIESAWSPDARGLVKAGSFRT
ncbi:MAG: hypothetical protein AAFZ65_10200, partial [Planctomycetota bacterium]